VRTAGRTAPLHEAVPAMLVLVPPAARSTGIERRAGLVHFGSGGSGGKGSQG
jgi:hypothetical protein